HRRPPDLRRRRGTGARPRGDDRPRAEGHHVPASRVLAGTTLPRPHPGVGSPVTPSPFAQIVTVASYEIRQYIRCRRPLAMLILLALIVGLFVGFPPALGIQYATTPDAFVSTFATF